MNAIPIKGPIPPDVLADGEAIIAALLAGKKVDPEIENRVRAEADRIKEEIFKKHGLLNIGTQAIRELRDE
jgi:hypothetical protein